MTVQMKYTILEIFSYFFVLFVWTIFRRYLKRNITGDILAGAIVGLFLEFSTKPVNIYHFHITIYKDLPLIIPFDWGMMFAVTVYLSEKAYRFVLREPCIKPKDKRIFLFDVIIGTLVGFPLETAGAWLGAWEYNLGKIHWTLGNVPIFHMPWETVIAYALIMLVGPTFVRYWQASFEGRP